MAKYSINNCAIVILAAGTSSRLGSPKQLLIFNNKTLLQHAIDTALNTGCKNVMVVLGAHFDLIKNQLTHQPVQVIENKDWQEGMASSIRYALQNITMAGYQPECVIFMVCDQPFVTSTLLLALIEEGNKTGSPIIAAGYGEKAGTPALFNSGMFLQLLELEGDKGARSIFEAHPRLVTKVPFPEGVIDVDTVADYELLKRENDC